MKQKLLVALFSLCLVVSLSACTITNSLDEDMTETTSDVELTENIESTTVSSVEEEMITSSEEELIVSDNVDEQLRKYADDSVVNRFINEFNSISKYEFSDISRGNIKTKYFGNANECYIEMINANDTGANCFSITINGGNEISDRDRMFETFGEIIKILDSNITDDKVTEVTDYLKSEKYMVQGYTITDEVVVETYVPIVELSYGKTACRIDVISSNYR